MTSDPTQKDEATDDDSAVENIQFEVADDIGATDEADTERAESPDSVSGLQQALTEANERVLRSQAELENFRRRMRRERDEERQFAFQPLLVGLLPVIDNIDRALESADDGTENAGLIQGFQMVAQQLKDVLAQHHCKEIQADGVPFDPTLHEALAQQPSGDVPPGTVVGVHQKGYQLQERVIRPAQVIVSKEIE